MKKIILSSIVVSVVSFANFPVVTDVEGRYSNNNNIQAYDTLRQNIDVGFANTTGNTKTTNFNVKYGASNIVSGLNNQPLKWVFDTSMFLTRDSDSTTNEEYVAMFGLEQNIAHGWLGYTSVNWLHNRFRNYDNKFSMGAGLGKMLVDDGKHSLSGKFGVAYNVEDYSNSQPGEKFWSLNQYLEYNNKLNESNVLYFKLGAMQNMDNLSNDYEFIGILGLNISLSNALYLKVEQEVAYDALPPVGFDKTDTKTIVSLGYKF